MNPTETELIGWIAFNGEFQLYPRKKDIGRTFDETCVSGQFAKRGQHAEAARRFDGRRVRITGTLLSADRYWSGGGLGSLVENYCGSKQVFIATGIRAEPSR